MHCELHCQPQPSSHRRQFNGQDQCPRDPWPLPQPLLQPLLSLALGLHPKFAAITHGRASDTKKSQISIHLALAAFQSVLSKLDQHIHPRPPIQPAEPGTGRWLFNKPLFRDCFELHSSSRVVVYGPAGHGKTTLAGLIIRELSGVSGQRVLQYFFCSTAANHWVVFVSFVSSLLHQLWSPVGTSVNPAHCIRALEIAQAALQQDRDPEGQFRSLWAALTTVVARLPSFVLVVDGLDECPGDASSGLAFLPGLLDQLSRTHPCRLVVLARKKPCLTRIWPLHEAIVMDASQTQHDVDVLIEAEFESTTEATSTTSKLPRRILADVLKIVHEKAQGSLLWLRMYLDHLQDASTEEDLDRRLSEFPRNLADAYQKLDEDGCRGFRRDEMQHRRDLLLTALTSLRPLKIDEIASLHQFRKGKESDVLRFSRPFLILDDGYVKFTHSTVREYLLIPSLGQDAATYRTCVSSIRSTLAEKTVAVLSKPEFGDLGNIKDILLQNIEELDEPAEATSATRAMTEPAYDYAAKSWYQHVAEAEEWTERLAQALRKFLPSAQFVHWAEYVTNADGEGTRLSRSREILRDCAVARHGLDLEHYCIFPYQTTSSRFDAEAGDQLLRWLTLKELGNYLFLVGDTDLTWKIRKQVADELGALLGREHPLFLRALSESAYSCFLSNDMRQALTDYQYLYETQSRILGPDKPGTLTALAYRGHAHYYMGHVDEALESLWEAVEGFRRLLGETHINTLGFLWNVAILFEAYGRDEEAMVILRTILEERVKALGDADLFAVMVRFSIGNISRRRMLAEETFEQLNQAYQARASIWPKTHYLVVDAALARAVAYWQFGMIDEGMTQLRDIELDKDLMSRHQRLCQWTHLQALFSLRGHESGKAIAILRTLSLNTERAQVNRALLWARLDLALLLRRINLEDEASALFHNMVHDPDHDPGHHEPDPPRYLDVAERALRYTRVGRTGDASSLLKTEGLQWARDEDLWFWVGGPRPDTEFMREP